MYSQASAAAIGDDGDLRLTLRTLARIRSRENDHRERTRLADARAEHRVFARTDSRADAPSAPPHDVPDRQEPDAQADGHRPSRPREWQAGDEAVAARWQ